MATKLEFDWEAWDASKDVQLDRPGNIQGLTAIQLGTDIGDAPDKDRRERDQDLKAAIDGVIGLLAGSLQWLRYYGFSAAEVQNKVKAYKLNNLASPEKVRELAEWRAITEYSNPNNVRP